MNAEIPDFIANNPEALRAYLAGQARAADNLANPDQQLLPNPKKIPETLSPVESEPEQIISLGSDRKSVLGSFDQDTGLSVVEHNSVEANTPTIQEAEIGLASIERIRKERIERGRGPGY